MRGLLLLLVLAGMPAMEAWSLRLDRVDPVVRHGLVWRARVTGDIPPARFAQGPYVAQVSLTQGSVVLASQEFHLDRLGQVHHGLDVVLVPGMPPQPEPVELAVTISDAARRDLRHLTQTLATPRSLQRGVEQRQRQLALRGDRHPLPALWLEQAAELLVGGASLSTCRQLADLTALLDGWLADERPVRGLRALRDPTDDSVQPYRLHLPATPATALVVLLSDHAQAPRKSAWPTPPEAWLSAARAAGCAVVEIYPAGDAAWDGIALRRVALVVAHAAAHDQTLAGLPLLAVGSGRGAAGVVALGEGEPGRWRALGLIDGRLPVSTGLPGEPHQRWRALHRVAERPAHLTATTLVVGGGDAGVRQWAERLSLAGNPPADGGDPGTSTFWHALQRPPPAPLRREWLVLAPGPFATVAVEELEHWGIAGSLVQDGDMPLRSFGITRLRPLTAPATPVGGPPRKQFGRATGPLGGYANGPFTVVLGTGESAAAQADNHDLARRFLAAWAAHAHGSARLVEDTAVDDRNTAGHHLVLIGNPRSNRVLARLAEKTVLPLTWDARTLVHGQQRHQRADRPAVALAWPHPAQDGRLLVVLDGAPSWRDVGLPLAGPDDLLIVPASGGPGVQATFGNDWR
jgi:hypothetical protein